MPTVASERNIMMKSEELSTHLGHIVSACMDYNEMQAEILTLLKSYPPEMETTARPLLLLLERLQKEKIQAETKRQVQLVKSAINTLSYTELEVIVRIFDALGAPEGVLIAGKIADGIGITRSVVVSALRKLESASIIETRSLGAKGTYIKILNPLWEKELRKLRV